MNALKAMLDRQAALKTGATTVPSLPAKPPEAPAESVTPAAPKPGLNFLKAKPTGSAPAKVATVAATPEPPVADHVMSLDDLSDSQDEGLQTARESVTQHFADEIPATAPTRDLPDDLSTQQLEFVAQLNSIYEIVHDPELFGQFIRTIMQELQENPDNIKLMADQDVHVMIRGLRESMGLARVKKVERSTKAKGPAGTRKSTTAGVADMRDALGQMFGDDAWT